MHTRSLVLAFAVSVAAGLMADWAGSPPKWFRRAFERAASLARPGVDAPATRRAR